MLKKYSLWLFNLNEKQTQRKILVKKLHIILLIVAILFVIVGCQETPTHPDPTSIQNTAIAVAWTSVSQTQIASTPQPTQTPTKPLFSPENNFEMSWNIYDSRYNTLGGILTIRKQDSKYTKKLVMPDGSSGTYNLTIISEGNVGIKLTDSLGNPFGDYMLISKDGSLRFYDDQGFIYSVPPLN